MAIKLNSFVRHLISPQEIDFGYDLLIEFMVSSKLSFFFSFFAFGMDLRLRVYAVNLFIVFQSNFLRKLQNDNNVIAILCECGEKKKKAIIATTTTTEPLRNQNNNKNFKAKHRWRWCSLPFLLKDIDPKSSYMMKCELYNFPNRRNEKRTKRTLIGENKNHTQHQLLDV